MNLGKKSPSRNWAIAGGFFISLIAGLLWWSQTSSSAVSYKEFTVARGGIDQKVLSTGVVQPENRLEIKPPIAGRVESVQVTEGRRVKKGDILAWMSSTERAALLDSARARGPEETKKWEELYRPTPILAPINGTIILRKVEPGQTFTSQDAILVMSDRLTIKAQIDETDIAQIKLKQQAEIILDAYPGKKIPGHVDQIAFEAKTINNVTTYIVDVLPDQIPDFMRSGMTANVTVSIATKADTLFLPLEAVKSKSGESYVHLAPPQSREKPTKTVIETGIADGKIIEITSGLKEGDVVLIPLANDGLPKKKKPNSSPFSSMGSTKKPK